MVRNQGRREFFKRRLGKRTLPFKRPSHHCPERQELPFATAWKGFESTFERPEPLQTSFQAKGVCLYENSSAH
jgi:hypothetical protein